jgi:hypothetical protein
MGDFGIRPMSPDARYLGFLGIDYQVYVQDTCIGAPGGCVPSTTLASIADDGSPANLQCGGVAITANGRYVAFGSYASDLVPGDTNYSDTNAGFDVFVHDTCIGADGGCTPHTVRVSLAADGSQADDAIDGYIVISGDGSYTAFSALADLVPGLMPASRNVFIVRNDAYMSGLDKTSSSNNIHK